MTMIADVVMVLAVNIAFNKPAYISLGGSCEEYQDTSCYCRTSSCGSCEYFAVFICSHPHLKLDKVYIAFSIDNWRENEN
jgi:hypothetical protein